MKYESVSKEEAEEGWRHVFEESLKCCMHGPKCAQGPECQVSSPSVPPRFLFLSLSRSQVVTLSRLCNCASPSSSTRSTTSTASASSLPCASKT